MDFLYSWLRADAQSAQDVDWRMEAEVAEELGFGCHSFDCQTFLEGDPEEAFESLPDGAGETLVYRGWMLKTEDYETLEQWSDRAAINSTPPPINTRTCVPCRTTTSLLLT